MRKGTLAASLIGTIGVAMLFTVSLPSCGCQEPWMDFLLAFGVEGAFDSSNLDGNIITAAAQKHLIGKPLTKIEFPKETQPTSCISKTPRHFDCEFWFIKGPVREKGFHVTISANEHDSITSAKVSNMHRLLGYWRVGS